VLFLMVLVGVYAATWLIPPRSRWTNRKRWLYALAAGMLIAGVGHLVSPEPFIQHIPPWVPDREALVFVSGLMEVAFGVALVWPTRLRPRVGYALAAFLVAVFPGNIYVAVAGVDVEGLPGGAYPWIRLALQPLFIWLAIWSTRTNDVRPAHRSTVA
jgi:uncharacterized membrane protein